LRGKLAHKTFWQDLRTRTYEKASPGSAQNLLTRNPSNEEQEKTRRLEAEKQRNGKAIKQKSKAAEKRRSRKLKK
jgi:hypothetical protein